MHTTTHLHFKGNCREAFNSYAKTFGGEVGFVMTYGESPVANQTPPSERNQVMHSRVDFADQYLLGMDVTGERYQPPQGFHVTVEVGAPEEAERIFKALAQGGTSTMPIQETFWAKRFGMCTDRFGTPWMVNCAKPIEADNMGRKSS